MTYADYVNQNQKVEPPKKKASGGLVFPNQVYKVGEQGEELFVPQTGGTIVPNDEIKDGGGVKFENCTISFNIPNQQTMSQWMKEVQVMQ